MVFSGLTIGGVLFITLLLAGLFFAPRRRMTGITVCGSLVVLVLLFLAVFILQQRLWRKAGAEHLVRSITVSNSQLRIVQVYDGYGLNSTYTAVKYPGEQWKWYPLGNDDLYWADVRIEHLKGGGIAIGKGGKAVVTFNPATRELKWYGQDLRPIYEGDELPGGNTRAR